MYNSTEISQRIKKVAKSKNMVIKVLLADCDLSVNALSSMNSGNMPLVNNLAKIADYLDVSVDFLLGREKFASEITANNSFNSGDNNTNVIGDNASINIHLTADEKQVLQLYRDLGDIVLKSKAVTFIFELGNTK